MWNGWFALAFGLVGFVSVHSSTVPICTWGITPLPKVLPLMRKRFWAGVGPGAMENSDGRCTSGGAVRRGSTGPTGPKTGGGSVTGDVKRTFEFSIDPGATPAQNLFLIN